MLNYMEAIDDIMSSLNDALLNHMDVINGIANENSKASVASEILPEEECNQVSAAPRQTKVKIKIAFMKIGVIDTIKDRFSADVMVTTKWRETSLDGKMRETIAWDKLWTPKATISNVIGDVKMNTSHHAQFDKSGRALAIESKKFSGQFYERMELHDFPFDKQDLTICVISERSLEEVELVEDDKDECGINLRAFSAEQEWALEETLSKCSKVVHKKVDNIKTKHSSFCVAAKASRRPQFFIFNVVLILMALCSLCFASFTVSMELVPNRLQLTFTLILTCVTFKFVVSKSLPKISYLTLVDKYILGTMMILIFICFWHAISGGLIFENFPKAGQSSNILAIASDLNITPPLTATPGQDNPGCTTKHVVSSKPGPYAVHIDKMALAAFGSTFVILNLMFASKVVSSYFK